MSAKLVKYSNAQISVLKKLTIDAGAFVSHYAVETEDYLTRLKDDGLLEEGYVISNKGLRFIENLIEKRRVKNGSKKKG